MIEFLWIIGILIALSAFGIKVGLGASAICYSKVVPNRKKFFDEHNPWAMQSVSARMLEAIRKVNISVNRVIASQSLERSEEASETISDARRSWRA